MFGPFLRGVARLPSESFFTLTVLVLLAVSSTTVAQYPPQVTDLTVLRSPVDPNILVRYKTPDQSICNTTNPRQKQYAGHITLPPNTLTVYQNYTINTFFWFFEAREDPENAPFTIWLNGGPGSSSLVGLMQEVGPCYVTPDTNTTLKTVPREYGWDRTSNMLFIDQPVQVGYSYDVPTNGVRPLLDLNDNIIPGAYAPPGGGGTVDVNLDSPASLKLAQATTNLMNGTFSSGNPANGANTTQIAAEAMWHFLQSWTESFPQYYPKSKGINLVAESYGGKYGPSFSAFMERMNHKIQKGELLGAKELKMDSLGIVNGCIDDLIQAPYYSIYGHNNPYNIVAVSERSKETALENFYKPGGCKDLIAECRKLADSDDPLDYGDSPLVNLACKKADQFCTSTQMNPYMRSGRAVYDIAHGDPDSFLPEFYLEYLNNATVQQAVGSPVNFTTTSMAVFNAFKRTGDFARGGMLENIAYLLERGVRVGLIYGDRDFICNYMGGEAVSLAIPYPDHEQFASSGYQDMVVPGGGHVGGQTRQYGNFSFTRVFQAGHLVPAYQPAAAWTIFSRLISGRSIADGSEINTDPMNGKPVYHTTGKLYSDVGLVPPNPPNTTCYLRSIGTCTKEQFAILAAGEGTIVNGVLLEHDTPDIPLRSPGADDHRDSTELSPIATSMHAHPTHSQPASWHRHGLPKGFPGSEDNTPNTGHDHVDELNLTDGEYKDNLYESDNYKNQVIMDSGQETMHDEDKQNAQADTDVVQDDEHGDDKHDDDNHDEQDDAEDEHDEADETDNTDDTDDTDDIDDAQDDTSATHVFVRRAEEEGIEIANMYRRNLGPFRHLFVGSANDQDNN